jgi:hypothetical protein
MNKIPDFRLDIQFETKYQRVPGTYFHGKAEDLALAREIELQGAKPDICPDLCATDHPSMVTGWQMGIHAATIYGEPAICITGSAPNWSGRESWIMLAEDVAAQDEAMRKLGLQGLRGTSPFDEELTRLRGLSRVDLDSAAWPFPTGARPKARAKASSRTPSRVREITVNGEIYATPGPVASRFDLLNWAAFAALEWIESGTIDGTRLSGERAASYLKQQLGVHDGN